MDPQQKVKAGYDRMADSYLASRNIDDPVTIAALEELVHRIPGGGTALDIGCGAGMPVTQWLAQHFEVTGVDVSARQVELARQHVPEATFIRADIASLAFPATAFDVVVAFYSIIHVPQGVQPALVNRVHHWLKPGGAFLATWAIHEWEGEDENWEGWGAPMWWSHYDADTNLTMLRRTGFHIESAETRASNGESWLWILARK